MINHFVAQPPTISSSRESSSSRSSQRSNRSHRSYTRESSHTPINSDFEWVTPEIEEQERVPLPIHSYNQTQPVQKGYHQSQTTQNTRLQYQAGEWELETAPSDNDNIDRQTATDIEFTEGEPDDQINNDNNNSTPWTDIGPEMERGLEAIKYSTLDIARRLRQAEQERKALEQQLLMT